MFSNIKRLNFYFKWYQILEDDSKDECDINDILINENEIQKTSANKTELKQIESEDQWADSYLSFLSNYEKQDQSSV